MPTPSLLIVPARFKSGKLYSQIPTSGAGDFTVTRATAATRVNASGLIESVASGIPRLDYFASGGTVGCPALLVEPSAANGILNSTNTTTNWTLGANLTSGAIDVIGVSGNNLTVAVSGSSIGDAAGRLVRFSNNVALASGSTYTISFLMKKTGAHTIGGYILSFSPSGTIGSGFNVSGSFSSGSITDTAPTTNRIRRVEQWGTDVYRCSETFTMTAAATGTHLSFGPNNSVTVSTNSAVGTSMGFAAPQIELGSVPTSFIPTTTGSVTRNADVVSVSGAVSGSIGQASGTIYIEVQADVATNDIIYTSKSVANSVIILKNSNNGFLGRIYHSSNLISFNTANNVTGMVKIALAYKSGDSAMFMNGVQVETTKTDSITFGATLSGLVLSDTGFFAGQKPKIIRAAALYTTRLTNAELAALTSP